jgi:hypothetical protein
MTYSEAESKSSMWVVACGNYEYKENCRWRNLGKVDTQIIIELSGFQEGEHPGEFHLTNQG